jgi:beta-glucosidase
MDNFKWAWGYVRRFDVVFVDYKTQQRTLKDNGYLYRAVIAANAVND